MWRNSHPALIEEENYRSGDLLPGDPVNFPEYVLYHTDISITSCQALILAPSLKIAKKIKKWDAFNEYNCLAVGSDMRNYIEELDKGVHVVFGTPVSVNRLIQNKTICTDFIKIVALVDYKDGRIWSEFILPQIKEIFDKLFDVQCILLTESKLADILDIPKLFGKPIEAYQLHDVDISYLNLILDEANNQRKDNFENMNLKETLLRGICRNGFEKPTEFQKKVLTPCVYGFDLIVKGQSSVEKYATFAMSVLQRIDTSLKACQALIFTCNRVHAIQIYSFLMAFGENMSINCSACIRGHKKMDDNVTLSKLGVHVLVGTTECMLNMVTGNPLYTTNLKIIVVYDNDNLFKDYRPMNFGNVMTHKGKFLKLLDEIHVNEIQFNILTALDPTKVVNIYKPSPNDMNQLRYLFLQDEDLTCLDDSQQNFIFTETEEEKFEELLKLFEIMSYRDTVIFCNSKQTVNFLAREMRERNFPVYKNIGEIKSKQDLTTKGLLRIWYNKLQIWKECFSPIIDILPVSCIINFEFPLDERRYFQRVNRNGFANSISFVNRNKDLHLFEKVKSFYKLRLKKHETLKDLLLPDRSVADPA